MEMTKTSSCETAAPISLPRWPFEKMAVLGAKCCTLKWHIPIQPRKLPLALIQPRKLPLAWGFAISKCNICGHFFKIPPFWSLVCAGECTRFGPSPPLLPAVFFSSCWMFLQDFADVGLNGAVKVLLRTPKIFVNAAQQAARLTAGTGRGLNAPLFVLRTKRGEVFFWAACHDGRAL